MTFFTLAAVVAPWIIVAVAAWLGYEMVRRQGRLLIRISSIGIYLEALQEHIADLRPAALPEGLSAGLRSPQFELDDLDGRRVRLSDFLGRRVLLIFFSPDCSYCQRMAPDLAKLPWDGREGRPIPLVVSTGDREANRMLVAEHGIRCPFVLQEQMGVAAMFGALGTPIGFLVDELGILASGMKVGASEVLALASVPSPAVNGGGAAGSGQAGAHDVTVRGDRRSALQRNAHRGGGIRPGTMAPPFILPRLDAGRLSLDDYRGRRLLLVFSSPDCPACDTVVPELEQIHRSRPDLPIVMVTRGGPDENRRKIAELGVTFPVVLQSNWEVSRRYRKFATPAAYVIDEEGNIASNVAVGGAILALATRASEAPRKEVGAPVTWRKFR